MCYYSRLCYYPCGHERSETYHCSLYGRPAGCPHERPTDRRDIPSAQCPTCHSGYDGDDTLATLRNRAGSSTTGGSSVTSGSSFHTARAVQPDPYNLYDTQGVVPYEAGHWVPVQQQPQAYAYAQQQAYAQRQAQVEQAIQVQQRADARQQAQVERAIQAQQRAFRNQSTPTSPLLLGSRSTSTRADYGDLQSRFSGLSVGRSRTGSRTGSWMTAHSEQSSRSTRTRDSSTSSSSTVRGHHSNKKKDKKKKEKKLSSSYSSKLHGSSRRRRDNSSDGEKDKKSKSKSKGHGKSSGRDQGHLIL